MGFNEKRVHNDTIDSSQVLRLVWIRGEGIIVPSRP